MARRLDHVEGRPSVFRQPIPVFTCHRQDRVEQERSWTSPLVLDRSRSGKRGPAESRTVHDTPRLERDLPGRPRGTRYVPRADRRPVDDPLQLAPGTGAGTTSGAGQLRRMRAAGTADVWRRGERAGTPACRGGRGTGTRRWPDCAAARCPGRRCDRGHPARACDRGARPVTWPGNEEQEGPTGRAAFYPAAR